MRAEIVAVGTELLLGQIVNTNERWIGEELAVIGVDVPYGQVVGDNLVRIVDALRLATSRADAVLVTGGLGPTQDDLTRDAIAALLGVEMERDPEIERFLRERFRAFGYTEMPPNNLRQADVPIGVGTIMPVRGTAPGLIAPVPDGGTIYAVPGVPAEMVEMMEGTILPELASRSGGALISRVLRCAGIGESRVAEIVADLYGRSSNPSMAFLASAGEVKIRLTAKAPTREEAGRMLAPLVDEVRVRLGDVVFTAEDESLEEAVLRLLRASERTIACAESLTGGGVGARLSRPPGASASFRGSAVVYTPEAKRDVVGVSQETLDGPGVVSEACAREMAAGARKLYGADIAISFTGAAGPEPHDGAEPGTVWIALDADDLTHARGMRFSGERERVVKWSEQEGLDLVRRYLEGRPLPASEL
jgi:nicotinamide-nucleotide amidase